MAEQAGGAERRSAKHSGGRRRQFARVAWCGARARGSQPAHPGGVGAPPGGTTAPARSWLTDPVLRGGTLAPEARSRVAP